MSGSDFGITPQFNELNDALKDHGVDGPVEVSSVGEPPTLHVSTDHVDAIRTIADAQHLTVTGHNRFTADLTDHGTVVARVLIARTPAAAAFKAVARTMFEWDTALAGGHTPDLLNQPDGPLPLDSIAAESRSVTELVDRAVATHGSQARYAIATLLACATYNRIVEGPFGQPVVVDDIIADTFAGIAGNNITMSDRYIHPTGLVDPAVAALARLDMLPLVRYAINPDTPSGDTPTVPGPPTPDMPADASRTTRHMTPPAPADPSTGPRRQTASDRHGRPGPAGW